MVNRFLPALGLVAACALIPGCAGTPAGDAPAKADTTAAPVTPASAQELAAELDPVLAEAAKGYERVTRNGKLFFCKRERPVGSKMWTTVCVSEAQLREQAEVNRKAQEGILQQGRRCPGAPGC